MKLVLLFVLAVSLHGCALLSKGTVPTRRYFSPDVEAGSAPVGIPPASAELRLGRITSSAFLGERIMFRESDHEVGFYDDRIWTEKPEAYLRRALTRVLFEEQGLRSVVRGAGPSLDLELISFEEVMTPVHLARVKISFSLSDERVVSLQQTLTVERPVAASSPQAEASAVAEAMGVALRDAVNDMSGRVIADLARGRQTSPQCPVAAVR